MSASDSSRVLFDVRITIGRCDAPTIVPSSGIDTWKSDSTSSSSASVSISTRSTSSMRSTTGSSERIASSNGRVRRNGSLKMSDSTSAQLGLVLAVDLDPQELLLVVPLVERLGLVEALVALEPDQPRAGDGGDRLGQLGLADARGPFDEHRLLQAVGEEHHAGDADVGQVVGLAQPRDHVIDTLETLCHLALRSPVCRRLLGSF